MSVNIRTIIVDRPTSYLGTEHPRVAVRFEISWSDSERYEDTLTGLHYYYEEEFELIKLLLARGARGLENVIQYSHIDRTGAIPNAQ